MLVLIGKYLVLMLKISNMYVGNLIKMHMLQVGRNVQLSRLCLCIRIGLKLALLIRSNNLLEEENYKI